MARERKKRTASAYSKIPAPERKELPTYSKVPAAAERIQVKCILLLLAPASLERRGIVFAIFILYVILLQKLLPYSMLVLFYFVMYAKNDKNRRISASILCLIAIIAQSFYLLDGKGIVSFVPAIGYLFVLSIAVVSLKNKNASALKCAFAAQVAFFFFYETGFGFYMHLNLSAIFMLFVSLFILAVLVIWHPFHSNSSIKSAVSDRTLRFLQMPIFRKAFFKKKYVDRNPN
jgi:hypothetical protein